MLDRRIVVFGAVDSTLGSVHPASVIERWPELVQTGDGVGQGVVGTELVDEVGTHCHFDTLHTVKDESTEFPVGLVEVYGIGKGGAVNECIVSVP